MIATKDREEAREKGELSELRSRRLKLIQDDRKYFPVLDFDGIKNVIFLRVKRKDLGDERFVILKKNGKKKSVRDEEIVGEASSIRLSNKLTVLAASSAVELTNGNNLEF
jgi:hypothetical protein